MKLTSLILFILAPFVCQSQSKLMDSLKRLLPSLKDSARIDCLNELGFEFSDRYWSKSKYQQTDTAYMYTLQALNESQQLHYLKGMGKAFQNMGTIEEEHGNFIMAEEYIRKALPVLSAKNMQADYNRSLILLGWIRHNRGFFSQSITLYKTGLPYYEALKNPVYLSAIYRIIARAYDAMGNSEDAFTYFQKDFAIKKNATDTWGKRSTATLKAAVYMAAGDTASAASCYREAGDLSVKQHVILEGYHLNRAIAYNLLKKYDSAMVEMHKSIYEIKSSDIDSLFRKPALMIGYGTLTDLFLSLRQFDSAVIYSQQPLLFFRKNDYTVQLMPLLRSVANAYYQKHQYTDATDYTNQLLFYAQRSGARKLRRDGYRLLWQIYTAQRKSTFADRYHLKYILLNDSLQNDKYISQAAAWKAINDININEADYKSQLAIHEAHHKAKIEVLNNQKRLQFYVFTTAIVVIGLLTVLIRRNNRLKRRKEQLQLMMTEAVNVMQKQKQEQEVAQLLQQKSELEMQTLRTQMNPHFIFNCLSSINRYILINKVEEASDYLTKFSRLIRMALHNSEKSLIALESELEALRLYLDLERLRFKNAFNYSITFINTIDVNAVYIPPMLIQPFTENAIWHGLMHKKGIGCLEIQLCAEDKTFTCIIVDNGIGRKMAASLNSRSAEKNKSMGMEITTGRLALFNKAAKEAAFFNIEDLMDAQGNGCGTKVTLTMPYKDLTEVVE